MSAPTSALHVRIRDMDAPDIVSYLDYRHFLRDWFDWKKAENPRYSHRLFSRRAGVRSPSLLLLVIEGKRNLTGSTTAGFCSAMGLAEAEARHFGLLVRLDQAETPAERAAALEEVLATKRFREARRMEADSVRYMAHWWFPAIHELAHRADFEPEPDWIAAQLAPQISVSQAREALAALIDLGLLADDEEGVPRPTDRHVVTPHEVSDLAFRSYHLGMLERAGEAIDRFDQDRRHVLGLTVSIPTDLVPTIKGRLNEVQRELLSLCEQEPREHVYQLSIAFFPLTGHQEVP